MDDLFEILDKGLSVVIDAAEPQRPGDPPYYRMRAMLGERLVAEGLHFTERNGATVDAFEFRDGVAALALAVNLAGC